MVRYAQEGIAKVQVAGLCLEFEVRPANQRAVFLDVKACFQDFLNGKGQRAFGGFPQIMHVQH